MPDDDAPAPEPKPPEQPTLLGGVAPDEMLARGMQSVKMTSGAQGTWQPPSIDECARLFPGYEVLRLLGRGGMGAVYQARQIELDRLVAVKLLPLEVSVDKDFADRFRREARAMAKLHHPHIITVFDFGTTSEGHLYFVMEFVEGANLADLIHQAGLTGEQALAIVEQVCTALAYAHGKGVVHRDIKPANVMVDTESQVKVADFGLARLTDPSAEQWGHTMTGTVMGTPDYMAPEQMKGMNVDHRADIYSLGVMVYEMLCREVPRGAFEPPSVRIGCDPRIDPIVIKAMQPNPDRRYQSTQEMKSDVTAVREAAPVRASAPAPPPSLPRKPATPKSPPKAPLAPPETAVMQAIQPRAPKGKSKTLLYAGLAAAVVIIAAIVIPKLGGTRSSVSPTSPNATEQSAGTAVNDSSRPAPQNPATAPTESDGRAGAHPSEALEPGAIKLWDSPEKLPAGTKARWEDGAVHVEKEVGLEYSASPSRDAILRATIRINPDAEVPQLNLRWHWASAKKANFYRLQLIPKNQHVELFSIVQGDVKRLGNWPLPKQSATGEWVRLEFRAIGDELTVVADGQVVGTVRDNAVGDPGGVNIYAGVNGYFRDIVYVPLDKPGIAGVASPATTEPWQDGLRDPANLSIEGPAVVAPDGVDFSGGASVMLKRGPTKDGAARMRAKFDAADRTAQLKLKLRNSPRNCYSLFVRDGTAVSLEVLANGKYSTLRQFPLPTTWAHDQEYELELRVVGTKLTASLDGKVLGEANDSTVPGGQCGIASRSRGMVTAFAYLTLDSALQAGDAVTPLNSPSSVNVPVAKATKGAPYVNTLGMQFVPVPIIGGPTDKQPVLFSVWDTRVQDYEVFAKETKRKWPKPDFEQGPTHPAVNVTWDDAQAFCQWLTQREREAGRLAAGWTYRLPSDHEWSCAVGIGDREDAAKLPGEKSQKIQDVFPWGTPWPPPEKAGNYASEELQSALAAGKYPYAKGALAGYRDGYANTSPVGSFATNQFGLYDIGGNVWQWCEDGWDEEQQSHPLRGSAWSHGDRGSLLSSHRDHAAATERFASYSFRCVLAPASSTPSAAALPPTIARPSPSTEPWHDYLADLRRTGAYRKLQNGVEGLMDDGATLRAESNFTVLLDQVGRFRDGAIRVVWKWPAQSNPSLGLRGLRDSKNQPVREYVARLDAKKINLQLRDEVQKSSLLLREWDYPDNFDRTTEHTCEFRATGDLLTLTVDGREIGSVHDRSIDQPGVGSISLGQGTTLRELQTLRLDPTASPSPPAVWQKIPIPDTKALNGIPGATLTPAGELVLPHQLTIPDIQARNIALRGEVKRLSSAENVMIQLRKWTDGHTVSRQLLLAKEVSLQLTLDGSFPTLLRLPYPPAVDPEAWMPFEFATVEDASLATLGDVPLPVAHSAGALEPGKITLMGGQFRHLECLNLDGLPEAEALTLAGFTAAAVPAAGGKMIPATSASGATKDAPYVNTLGMKFVPVPITGGPTDKQPVLFSVWDTRVQDYAEFVKETKRDWQKPDFEQGPTHPAVEVSWEDAQAFCAWLTERERKAGRLGGQRAVAATSGGTDGAVRSSEQTSWAYRLLSDHEWSCAVGIGEKEDPAQLPSEKHQKIKDTFPWGMEWPPPQGAGNYAGEELQPALTAGKFGYVKGVIAGYNDGFVNASPVGSFAANRFGLYDMGGNVWQWCEDWYDTSHKHRVLRGASWTYDDRDHMLSSFRAHSTPTDRNTYYGFRCVLAPAAPTPLDSGAAAHSAKSASPVWQKIPPPDAKTLLTSTGATLAPTGELVLPHGFKVPDIKARNIAVRGEVKRLSEATPTVKLRAWNDGESGVRQFSLFPQDAWLQVGGAGPHNESAKYTTLAHMPYPPSVDPAQWIPFEFATIGDASLATLGGVQPPSVAHTTEVQEAGMIQLLFGQFRNIEYLNLDGLPDAEALKLAGLDVSEKEPPGATSAIPGGTRSGASPSSAATPPPESDGRAGALPSEATKDAPFVNSLGMKFVPVPITGGPTDKQPVLFSMWNTRVQDYEVFAKETKREWPKPDYEQGPTHPAVNVSWEDAQAFCVWLTERDRKASRLGGPSSEQKSWAYRLPTDHEWSCAVGIGDREDAAKLPAEKRELINDIYPWGTQWPPPKGAGNYAGEELRPALAAGKLSAIKNVIADYNDGFVDPSPVGSFAANRFGLYDMGGNVGQWCEDWFDQERKDRVVRGASRLSASRRNLLSSYRGHNGPTYRDFNCGFRCVLAPAGP